MTGEAEGSIERWRLRALQVYYAVTPVFILFEWLTGTSHRVPGLQHYPVVRHAYYAVLIGGGVYALGSSKRLNWLSLIECSVNIVLLVIGVLAPLLHGVIYGFLNDKFVLTQFTIDDAKAFVLVGTAALVSYYRNPIILSGALDVPDRWRRRLGL